MSWKVIENVEGLTYYPGDPEGKYITLVGECKPQGNNRYGHTEEEICGKEITIIVQLEVNDNTNGIRVWYPYNNTWYWQSSHFKNTLINDPEFDALISPMLTYKLTDR